MPKTVQLDVGVLEEIESALALDIYDRDTVAALEARAEEHRKAHRHPEDDDQLAAEIESAMDGGWLHLEEAYAIMRLRGWHRTRAGNITVRTADLFDVARVLGNLTISIGSECEETLKELEDEGNEDLLAAAQASMEATDYCGECLYCQVFRLRHECLQALYEGGCEMGIDYRMHVLGQSCDEANWQMYGYCTACATWNGSCSDPAHREG